MIAYPETEVHLNGLAEALLRGPSSLTPAERELIATMVSCGNECYFCTNAHAETAKILWGNDADIVDATLGSVAHSKLSLKMRTLLAIADKVRRDGRLVTSDDVATARQAGADDKAIHDTVLITAAFCMFNRYVDGLDTWTPRDASVYRQTGAMLAAVGYLRSIR
jgi:uncharacterized peroxidase-related enzyme